MSTSRGTHQVDTARIDDDTYRDWRARMGDGFPLPTITQEGTRAARVRSRSTRARDVAVIDFHTTARVRAGGSTGAGELRLHLVRRGSWTFRYGRGAAPVQAGRFVLGRSTGSTGFDVAPHTSARTVGLPPGAIALPGADPHVAGSATDPEVRLLLAHTSLLHETIDSLTEPGLVAARDALVELVRGVLYRYVAGSEPDLAPALARAARDLADRRLTDPDLTPAMLARDLHVSVRTLHRAFAATAEPVAAYIRRRRIEEAHAALTAPRPLPVSVVAARWQFADSSHFVRAFRRHYGHTPARYARDANARRQSGTSNS
ncbi:AraC family transcriptional regulator [Jidongwangia harbinensis]|uniref:AraC family transcriptional regulator n=1 Tax=Jidongwangia harbinensis TaxID=2878561 RepID=UPI001CDA304F|nr:AraC family transcriptional regulator [Jidongwangia harbinensis]MCA2213290.1 AraC family transcriptional regulator [Jidongwangia harbinensis]